MAYWGMSAVSNSTVKLSSEMIFLWLRCTDPPPHQRRSYLVGQYANGRDAILVALGPRGDVDDDVMREGFKGESHIPSVQGKSLAGVGAACGIVQPGRV